MSQLAGKHKADRKWIGKLIVVGISLYLIVVMTVDLVKLMKSGNRVKQAEEKVGTLEQEQEELERQLAVVESDAYVEQQIRDQLMLARPGETVVVIPFDLKQSELGEKVVQEGEENLANWQKWMRLFL